MLTPSYRQIATSINWRLANALRVSTFKASKRSSCVWTLSIEFPMNSTFVQSHISTCEACYATPAFRPSEFSTALPTSWLAWATQSKPATQLHEGQRALVEHTALRGLASLYSIPLMKLPFSLVYGPQNMNQTKMRLCCREREREGEKEKERGEAREVLRS